MSRGATLVLLAVLVTAALHAAAVAPPTASVGDRWTYDVPKADGSDNDTSITTVTTSGTDIVYETKTRVNVTGTPSPIPGAPPVGGSSALTTVTTTLDASTRAVKSVVTSTPQGTGGLSNQQTVTRTYDPACQLTKWPLTVNATWDVSCTYTESSNVQLPGGAPLELKSKFKVTDRRSVTVAGTQYMAYRVANETTVQYDVPAVCGNVREATLAGASETIVRELVTFTCKTPVPDDYVPPAPPAKNDTAPPANNTGNPGTGGNMTDDNMTDDTGGDDTDDTPAPPPKDEKKGLLPAPGILVLVALLGVAAVAWRRG